MKPAHRRLILPAMVTASLLTSAACLGNSPQSYFFPPANNEVGKTVGKSVDSSGGSLQTASGSATVVVPAGALAGATPLTVTVRDKALSPNAAQLLSQVYDLGPDGTQFLQPVRIALEASDPPPSGSKAVLAFQNTQGLWQVVPNSSYNATNQTVIGSVSHFTNFAVMFIDAQGVGCATSPDPSAYCSPNVCNLSQNLCAPAGSPTSFHVGGALAGLTAGAVVLQNNGTDTLSLSTNGNFQFATALDDNSAYAVTVSQQPNAQLCVVTAGSGRVATADVTQVSVRCASTYAIGGSVTGLLAGHPVVLQNGNDTVTVSAADANFVIGRATAGSAYAVTVLTAPDGQRCDLTGDTGTVGQGDVSTVRVSCTNLSYPVGGHVIGLVGGTQVSLRNGNDTISAGNGNFAFPTSVVYGGTYAASLTSPQGETCAFVGASSGTMGTAAVGNLAVACSPNAFSLGGRVSGLVGQTQVTLVQGNDTWAVGNGAYTLPTAVPFGMAYRITTTTAAGQACHFADGNTFLAATMPPANVTNANLVCTPATYSIGGVVSGLVGQTTVALQNGADSIAVGNGVYMFPSSVTYGGAYAATLTSPPGQTCNFSNAQSGTVGSANVTNVSVSCSPRVYTIGGQVSGLLSSNTVGVHNGADQVTLNNGAYTLPTSVAYGSAYNVTLTSPAGQTCTFSPTGVNAGTMGSAAVTGANIVCGAQAYNLGGTVSGLLSNTTVALSDAADAINAPNGSFTFPTPLTFNTAYSVTLMSPAGQACSFVGSHAGTMGAADVTNLLVTCQTLSYSLGGTVSGLVNSAQVVLHQGADTVTVGNGAYTFPTQVVYNASYSATLTAPTGHSCAFSPTTSNTGSMPASNVTQVNVACSPLTYTIGGSVSGLVGGATVSLQDGVDTLQAGLGAFTFATPIAYNAGFTVSVNAPAGQQCTLGGTLNGPMPAANVTNITVSCTPLTYTLGGSVNGLMYGQSVTLQNGADVVMVSNGPYTFPTSVAYNSNYSASLQTPGGQACTFSPTDANAGTMPSANVSSVNVNCVLVPYSISLAAPTSVVVSTPYSATLSILDVSGSVLTSFVGTLQLVSSDASGTPSNVPQDVPFGSGDQGSVTLSNLQFATTGSQMLTATDAADGLQNQAPVNVTLTFSAAAAAPKQACGRFFSGVEAHEILPLSAADAPPRSQHVAQWPEAWAPQLRVEQARGVAGSQRVMALRGVGTGGAPSYADIDAFDVTAVDITLDADAYVSYWIYPIAQPGDDAAQTLGASTVIHLTFDDGSDTAAMALHDAAGVALTPMAQGKHLRANAWNHVFARLGPAAGKRVQTVGLRWQRDGAEGPFEAWIDAVTLVGRDGCSR